MKEIKPHPIVKVMTARWEFLERSYSGGHEYKEGNYLIRHDLEHESAFKRRCEQAMFVNFCAPVIDIYSSFLFRDNPDRDLDSVKSKALDSFMADADLQGHTYEQVIRGIGRRSSIYGYSGVLVDKPQSIKADSRQHELDAGVRPYMVTYEPENIYNWSFRVLNGRKVLNWLVLKDESPAPDVRVFREWTESTWKVWSQEKNKAPELIEKGDHNLGLIPFVFAPNNMTKTSDIRDIADINKRIYYYDSDALEIIERTAYPLLEEPKKQGRIGDGDKVVGTGNVVQREQGDSVGHRWVEAPHTSLQRVLEWRNQAVQDIMMLAKTGQVEIAKSGAESGVALELRFQQLNALLSEKAESIESIECQVFRMFAAWEDMASDVLIKYPRKFGVRDLAHDIDVAMKAKLVVPSATFAKEVGIDLAGRYLRDVDDATRDKIEKELEQPNTLDLLNAD